MLGVRDRPKETRYVMNSALFVFAAVDSGIVVIAVAAAIVLVVMLVTVSMRGRQKRRAKGRREERRDVVEARERAGQAESDRDVERDSES
jgi:hypothetical protein